MLASAATLLCQKQDTNPAVPPLSTRTLCLLLALTFPLGVQLPDSSLKFAAKSKAYCLCEICPTPPALGQAQEPGALGHGAVAWLVIG